MTSTRTRSGPAGRAGRRRSPRRRPRHRRARRPRRRASPGSARPRRAPPRRARPRRAGRRRRPPRRRRRRPPRCRAPAWRSRGWRCSASGWSRRAWACACARSMSRSTELTTTNSAAETEALGARLASDLQAGDLVLVEGELGAGKTTLVRGAVRALGHHGRVTSPTFTLASRYEDARVPISHLDLYRLRGAGPDPEELALLEDDLADD